MLFESLDLRQFSIIIIIMYLSFYVCFRESGLNVPSKYFLFPGQAARRKKMKNEKNFTYILFSYVGVTMRAVLIFNFSDTS